MGITDIDDKIITRAREQQISWKVSGWPGIGSQPDGLPCTATDRFPGRLIADGTAAPHDCIAALRIWRARKKKASSATCTGFMFCRPTKSSASQNTSRTLPPLFRSVTCSLDGKTSKHPGLAMSRDPTFRPLARPCRPSKHAGMRTRLPMAASSSTRRPLALHIMGD